MGQTGHYWGSTPGYAGSPYRAHRGNHGLRCDAPGRAFALAAVPGA